VIITTISLALLAMNQINDFFVQTKTKEKLGQKATMIKVNCISQNTFGHIIKNNCKSHLFGTFSILSFFLNADKRCLLT
jgi:hypothetical protein